MLEQGAPERGRGTGSWEMEERDAVETEKGIKERGGCRREEEMEIK
jgi:hypothetical protein